MKVVAFNGSPRKEGNTHTLLRRVCDRLEKHGIETEIVKIGGKPVRGCLACGKCFETQDRECIIKNDFVNDCVAKMIEADGILLGSPTYFADMSTEMKALIDRVGYVTLANGSLLKGKVGASVASVRRGGSIHAMNSMNHFFTISQMVIPGSSYWNMGYGMAQGESQFDIEGMQTMDNLGENMAWIMKCIEASKGIVPAPDTHNEKQMNFIRVEGES